MNFGSAAKALLAVAAFTGKFVQGEDTQVAEVSDVSETQDKGISKLHC